MTYCIQGIVSLCLLFETLLQTYLPQLFYHLREIGAQPWVFFSPNWRIDWHQKALFNHQRCSDFFREINIFPNKTILAAAAKLLQSCPTLCDLMDCSLPGSSVHGIFQARVLEWLAIAFSEKEVQSSWFNTMRCQRTFRI